MLRKLSTLHEMVYFKFIGKSFKVFYYDIHLCISIWDGWFLSLQLFATMQMVVVPDIVLKLIEKYVSEHISRHK